MLDSSEFNYEPYKDGRVINRPGFTVGMSGPLLMATHKTTGQKFLVKHAYPHNAANEYTACWLAEKLGAPAPKAYLLTPNKSFATKYAVAIEYLDGLRGFKKEAVPEALKPDLIAQFALCLLLRLDDMIQLSRTDDHIYSYDFSEGFNIVDMRIILNLEEDSMVDYLRSPLQRFRNYTQMEDFNIPGLAREFNLDPEEMRIGMISTVKHAETITDDALNELSDELMEMYPAAIAVYYEECIRIIREKAEYSARKVRGDRCGWCSHSAEMVHGRRTGGA